MGTGNGTQETGSLLALKQAEGQEPDYGGTPFEDVPMDDVNEKQDEDDPIVGEEDKDNPTKYEEKRKLMRARLDAWELLPNLSDSSHSKELMSLAHPADLVRHLLNLGRLCAPHNQVAPANQSQANAQNPTLLMKDMQKQLRCPGNRHPLASTTGKRGTKSKGHSCSTAMHSISKQSSWQLETCRIGEATNPGPSICSANPGG
eukprot:2879343-Amphidinium_carterae.1